MENQDNQPNLNNLLKTQLLLSDLKELELLLFSESGINFQIFHILLNNVILTINHVYDFKKDIRLLFRDNKELSDLYKKDEGAYQFFKYLRNKLVGHLEPELIEQFIIWEPVTRIIANKNNVDVIQKGVFYKWVILETLVNTYLTKFKEYAENFGRSEVYFSNKKKDRLYFIHHIRETISSVINTLEKQELILKNLVPNVVTLDELNERYQVACQMEFKYLKK